MKRVFIVHGWGGNPNEPWFKWIKPKLEENGFEVIIPAMPNSDEPKIDSWVPFLKKQVGELNEETYFIGHSIGCQTIIRYLEQVDHGEKIGGIVLVAGWFNLKEDSYESDEERELAKPWIENSIDFEKVKEKTGDNIFALFSDNDMFVPIEDERLFKERLGARTLMEHGKGHFDPSSNITEIPAALEALLGMVK